MIKKITIIFSILVLFIFFFSSIYLFFKISNNPFTNYIKNFIPYEVKTALKKTIFSYPEHIVKRGIYYYDIIKSYENFNKTEKIKTDINRILLEKYMNNIISNIHNFQILGSDVKKIKSKLGIDYTIKNFTLPIPNNKIWHKPVAYLEEYNDKIFIVTGDAKFLYFNSNDINENKLKINNIKSNIKEIILNKELFMPGMVSVKDIMILNDTIYIAYTKEITSNCYNISILHSKINFKFLEFSSFFNSDECNLDLANHPILSGGRIVPYKNNKILLSIGAFHTFERYSQQKNSLFGKIISIDLNSKKEKIISLGHRNPQGLYYDKVNDLILSTDHGPKGGDEINIHLNLENEKINNYGWPMSSYGIHYGDEQFSNISPLYKSHEKYGFVEPIKYFKDGIGISQLVRVDKLFDNNFTNDFFISSMAIKKKIDKGARSIIHIRLDKNFEKITYQDTIVIGNRIRDMINFNGDKVLLLLESIPAVSILERK